MQTPSGARPNRGSIVCPHWTWVGCLSSSVT